MSDAGDSRREIAVRAKTIAELFNSLDPSPFRERDLDPQADDFIVGWVRELPHRAPLLLRIELPPDIAATPEADRIAEAVANHFTRRAEAAERDLRELFRLGWRSALIGLAVLVVCLTGSHLALERLGGGVVPRLFAESLVIVGWVANWRPIEIYLYDWWPIRRRIRLFRRIAAAPVEVRAM